jgi:SNF2 family DNA or RNA helicase
MCPAIAVEDWYRKLVANSSIKREVYRSFGSAPVLPSVLPPHSAVIWGYETAVRHRKLLQANPHGGLLIVDEAQYVKNGSTMRARALYGQNCSLVESECIAKHFERVWLLGGTPVPNGDPREMWPHLRALMPYAITDPVSGQPMTLGEWTDNFCILQPGLGTGKVIGIRNPERFWPIMQRFMLRRTGEVAGLPDVNFSVYPMEPRNVPTELAIENWPDLAAYFKMIIASAHAGDIDTQLEEQLATIRRLTSMLKVEATVQLVGEELQSGQMEKCVVFAYHQDTVREIARGLRALGSAAITGATSDKDRWEAIDAFNNDKKRVLVINLLTGGTNLSLKNCRQVVFAEVDWVPDNNKQAAYRCRRIDGHRSPVMARIISIAGTIDDLFTQVIRRKLRQIKQLMPNSGSG